MKNLKAKIRSALKAAALMIKKAAKAASALAVISLATAMVIQIAVYASCPKIIEIAKKISPQPVEAQIIKTVVVEKKDEILDKNLLDYVMSLDNKVKRNNPGNLRCADQLYSTGCQNGFAVFPNIIIGFRALVEQVKLDQGRELSLERFISKYSPEHENDTPWLIKCASNELGLDKEVNIKYIEPILLAKYMVKQEYSISY